MRQEVITVDNNDRTTGEMEKMEAHRTGALHRAFSVFIFNGKKEMLIHQRAVNKYHGGGLWTNACCSHPKPGEDIYESAARRLKEEMGIECSLEKLFSFIYKAEVENGLTEHEFDHVFVGYSDTHPVPDKEEVQDWKWILPGELLEEVKMYPERYTEWFKIALPQVLNRLGSKNILL